MGNLITAEVTIEGTRALLWHRFGPDAIPLERGERTGVAGNDPEEWRKTVLFIPETRQLYVEGPYVFASVRDGARYTKKGRGTLQDPVGATLQVLDEMVLVDRFLPEEPIPQDPTAPVFLDVRGVINPGTKGRNHRYRIGASPGWHMSFRLLWDKTVVSRDQMEACLRDAGKLCGIGNGRKIGFGRFDVQSCRFTNT